MNVVEPFNSWVFVAGGALLLVLGLAVLMIGVLYRRANANAERLRTMFEHAPLSMLVIDDQYRVRVWNRQAELTFHWRSDEVFNRSVIELVVPPEERDSVEEILGAVRAGRRLVRSENYNIRKDGTRVLCEWINAPFVDRRNQQGYLIAMARDITERKRLERELEQAAHYDSLTGLPNRTLILELLKQSIAIARRQRYHLAVLFLDLNTFKEVNDTHGHKAGDRVLHQTAQRLESGIREADHAGRLAGDEFLLILQNVSSRQSAEVVVEKLRQRVGMPLELDDGQRVAVTASIGVSMYPGDSGELEALIHQADRAMYRDKCETADQPS